MHVMRGERRRKQPDDQLAHLVDVEGLARFDGRAARVRRCKAFQTILPAAKPAAGEISDELLQAARGFEARVGIRRRVDDDAAAGERLDFVPDAREQLAMRLDRIEPPSVWKRM